MAPAANVAPIASVTTITVSVQISMANKSYSRLASSYSLPT